MVITTKAMEIGTLPDSIKASTLGTSLRGISWINQHNLISVKLGFVFNKLSQLVKAPTIKPISLFSTNSAAPNAFDVFHNNCIPYITRVYNCFADFVIALSHKTFLFSRYLLEKFSRTLSAFRLQSAPQISILGFNVFGMLGIKKLLVGDILDTFRVLFYNLSKKFFFRNFNLNSSNRLHMDIVDLYPYKYFWGDGIPLHLNCFAVQDVVYCQRG